MANFLAGILSLTIGAVVLSSVFMTTIKGTNQTYIGYYANGSVNPTAQAWTTAEVAMWGLIGLVAIAGMVYGVMNVFGLG